MTVMYTVDSAELLGGLVGGYKDTGGSVWFTVKEAHEYIDSLHTDGLRVQGAIYEVHVGSPLIDWIYECPGGWYKLRQPAMLGYKMMTGADNLVN